MNRLSLSILVCLFCARLFVVGEEDLVYTLTDPAGSLSVEVSQSQMTHWGSSNIFGIGSQIYEYQFAVTDSETWKVAFSRWLPGNHRPSPFDDVFPHFQHVFKAGTEVYLLGNVGISDYIILVSLTGQKPRQDVNARFLEWSAKPAAYQDQATLRCLAWNRAVVKSGKVEMLSPSAKFPEFLKRPDDGKWLKLTPNDGWDLSRYAAKEEEDFQTLASLQVILPEGLEDSWKSRHFKLPDGTIEAIPWEDFVVMRYCFDAGFSEVDPTSIDTTRKTGLNIFAPENVPSEAQHYLFIVGVFIGAGLILLLFWNSRRAKRGRSA